MKASELIYALENAISEHGDLEVEIEGCDCTGLANGVSLDVDTLLITRGGRNYYTDTTPSYLENVPYTLKDAEQEWLG